MNTTNQTDLQLKLTRTEVKTMDDLPDLPFEKVLSYLSLEDRLKSRAVSKGWRDRFDFRVKSLCFSKRPIGFLYGKARLVSGAFARNFISSIRFASFFNTFRKSILSNLKHLRLCDLRLNENGNAFAPTLNLFDQLEELALIRVVCSRGPSRVLKLNLSMLNSIHLEDVRGIEELTLKSSRLQKIKVTGYLSPRLELVHPESVEWLITSCFPLIEVKKLKNLKYLYTTDISIDSTFLSDLKQLREIHLNYESENISTLFEQKRQYGREDLKIYYFGLLLNGPDDPAMNFLSVLWDEETLGYLAENHSRLADEIPFCDSFYYRAIEPVAPELALNVVSRFTDLKKIYVNHTTVQDIERFLDFLKNFDNIVDLKFWSVQPQDLFDRLPEHSAVQRLYIQQAVPDVRFLFRLKHLVRLILDYPIDAESIRRILEELQFLSSFKCQYLNKEVSIRIRHAYQMHPDSKKIEILFDGKESIVSDPPAAVQFITQKKQKASEILE